MRRSHRLLAALLASTCLVPAALAQTAPAPPKSLETRIAPGASGTAAVVEMQDGSGNWRQIGVLNPTTGAYVPSGVGLATVTAVNGAGVSLTQNVAAWVAANAAAAAAAQATANGAVQSATAGPVFAGAYLSDLACGSDQTANLQRAIAAAGAGGNLILPPGKLCPSAGLVVPAGQRWDGAGYGGGGPNPSGGTQIAWGQASGVAVTMAGAGSKLSNLWLSNPVQNSTAVAVQMGDATGDNPDSQALDWIHVEGFSTQIDVQSGQYWHIDHFDLHQPGQFGIRVRNLFNGDSGDGTIDGGTIYADGANYPSLIRYESGGGLKIGHFKGLNGGTCIDLRVADAGVGAMPSLGTQDFLVDKTVSCEGQHVEGIHLGMLGTKGIFRNVRIDGQYDQVRSSIGPGISHAVLDGTYGNADYSWLINGGDDIAVAPTMQSWRMSVAAVQVNDPATHVSIPGRIDCAVCGYLISDTRAAAITSVTDTTDNLSVAAPGSAAPYTAPLPVYAVAVSAYNGVTVEVDVVGILQGAGPVAIHQVVQVADGGSGTLPQPTSISSTSGGAPMNLAFATPSGTNTMNITLQVLQNYGTSSFQGAMSIRSVGKNALIGRLAVP